MNFQFEKVSKYAADSDITLPVRKTQASAGHDIAAAADITIPSMIKLMWEMFKKNKDATNALIEVAGAADTYMAAVQRDPVKMTKTLTDMREPLNNFFASMTIPLGTLKNITKENNLGATLVPTGIKCKMDENLVLFITPRSSIAINHFLTIPNNVGVIDADYYNNADNEGEIFVPMINLSPFNLQIHKGDIIAQGIVLEYGKNDDTAAIRQGGFGSTN